MDKPIPDWLNSRIIRDGTLTVDVRAVPLQCSDCDQTVVNRRIRTVYSRDCTLKPHYKHQCLHCKQFKNPQTGEFDCDYETVKVYYRHKKSHCDK